MKTIVTAGENILGFPWAHGVRINILGDHQDLKNLSKELDAIKAMVNADANRFGLALKEIDIKIEFKG